MTRRIAILLASAALVFAQAPAKRLLKVDDMHRFHTVADPQISPDGKWVAYTVGTVDAAADKSDTDVWMVSWDGAEHLRLTTSTDAESAPRWSPDNRYLAFTSSRPGKAKGNQVWLLDRNGGEAQQLTGFKGRLSSYEWSPDSKRLLVMIADPDPNAPEEGANGGGRGAAGGANAPAPKPIVIDRYKFKQDVQGYLNRPAPRIYIYDIATKKLDALTDSAMEAAAPTWSPDGQRIAFLARAGKDADRYNTTNLFVMDAHAGATPKQLTSYDGISSNASRGRPEWSPDGKLLAYLQSSGARQGAYNMNRLAVISTEGGAPRILAGTLDRGVSAPRFTGDGSAVLFLVADDRSEYLARVPASGGAVERVTRGADVINALAQGHDGRLAALCSGDARSLRAGKRRAARTHPPQRRAPGRVEAGSYRGIQLPGEGRQRGPRAHGQAARLRRRQALPHAVAHPRRTQRAGRALVQLRAPVIRRQRLRRAGGELPRQFRTRREVSGRHLRRLGR
jgi:Tol biopolymer transport system component